MRILYIVQYFNLPHEPGGGRAYHFARRWVSQGHEVLVLTGTVNHKTATVAEKYRGSLFFEEEVEGIHLLRCASTSRIRRSLPGRMVNFLSFAFLSSVAVLFKVCRPDVVYASSTPLTVGLPGFLGSRRWRCPFVFEVRDLWPESAAVAGIIRNRLVLRLASAFEGFLYRRANRLVAVTEGIRDGIMARGVPGERVAFIPNGVDDGLFEESEAIELQHPEDGRFTCIYVGAIGMWNGNETIIDAARILEEKGAGIDFVLIGDGDQRQALEARVKEWGLNTITFRGVLPKMDAVKEIRRADVCLICTWDHPFHRMVLANKIFDYMASARPVVAAARGEMPQLLQRAGAGDSVPPGDGLALAGAILRMSHLSSEERRRMGRRGRDYVLSKYRRQDLADEALSVMNPAGMGGVDHH